MAIPAWPGAVPPTARDGWQMPEMFRAPLATDMDGGNQRLRSRPGDNVATIDYPLRPLSINRANRLRNSAAQGAVVGNPGTAPTFWGMTPTGGLSREIVAIGIEDGVEYVDVRIFGVSNGSAFRFAFDANNIAAAAVGQVWTSSLFCRLLAVVGTVPTIAVEIREYTSGIAGSTLGSNFVPAASPSLGQQRYKHTKTLIEPGVTHVQATLRMGPGNGVAYDFTLRLGWPQLEQGAFATSAGDEWAAFDRFVRTTLGNGASRFTMPLTIAGATVTKTVQFDGGRSPTVSQQGDFMHVTLHLRVYGM